MHVISEMTFNLKNAMAVLPDDKFFLSSQSRFDICKAAVAKIKTIFYCANFLNTEHINALSAVVDDVSTCEVALVNITNLKEFTKEASDQEKLQNHLNRLFGQNIYPLVLYSSRSDVLQMTTKAYPSRLVCHGSLTEMVIPKAPVEDTCFERLLSGDLTDDDQMKIFAMFLLGHVRIVLGAFQVPVPPEIHRLKLYAAAYARNGLMPNLRTTSSDSSTGEDTVDLDKDGESQNAHRH